MSVRVITPDTAFVAAVAAALVGGVIHVTANLVAETWQLAGVPPGYAAIAAVLAAIASLWGAQRGIEKEAKRREENDPRKRFASIAPGVYWDRLECEEIDQDQVQERCPAGTNYEAVFGAVE